MNRATRAAWARRPQEDCVLVDHRTYRLKPGTVAAHLDIYEKNGFAAQTRHLGQPVAYLFAETGELNTLVHIWAYEDAADRATRRAAMQADPEWKAYLKKSGEAGYLIDQRTSLMIPAGFAPIKR
jgi:NIPSNAP protein